MRFMVRVYWAWTGLFYFFLFFQHERQVVPQGVLSYTHSYLAFSSSLPFLLLFWILEFLSAHQHLSSQTLFSSLSISSCLKQLSPKLPPCPLTRATGWFWNWKWGIRFRFLVAGSNRIQVWTVHGIAESDTTEATGHACTLYQLPCRRLCPFLYGSQPADLFPRQGYHLVVNTDNYSSIPWSSPSPGTLR